MTLLRAFSLMDFSLSGKVYTQLDYRQRYQSKLDVLRICKALSSRIWKFTGTPVIAIGVLIILIFAPGALANTIKVTGSGEFFPGFCTLREAIVNHNNKDQSGSKACAAGSDDDTIELNTGFCDGESTERCAAAKSWTAPVMLAAPLPPISGKVTIVHDQLPEHHSCPAFITGGYFFLTKGAQLTIGDAVSDKVLIGLFAQSLFTLDTGSKLNISGGSAYFSNGARSPDQGGVIYNNHGSVLLGGSLRFYGNSARLAGGAIYNNGGDVQIGEPQLPASFGSFVNVFERKLEPSPNRAERGGAIYNNGGTVHGYAAFSADNASSAGGTIYNTGGGKIDLQAGFGSSGAGFSEVNFAPQGGAIYSDGGSVRITGVNRFSNIKAARGSIVFSKGGDLTIVNIGFQNDTPASGGLGGEISAQGSKVTISGSDFNGNSAGLARGGAIYVDSKSSLSMSGGSCKKYAANLGGCIYSDGAPVSLDGVVCDSNLAFNGGCLFMGGTPSTLSISNSQITNNHAVTSPGGGGILLQNTATSITNSQLIGNNAGKYKDGGSGSGGGIFGITSDPQSPTEIMMSGTTVASNTSSLLGAGVELENFSGLTAINSTFADEGPTNVPQHGIHFSNSFGNFISTTFSDAPLSVDGVVIGELRNSILSNSNFCIGNVQDEGFNLQFPAPFKSCATTIPIADPKLDPAGLKNNGGPTATIALNPASPAIDQIPLVNCTDASNNALVTDQRGLPRPDPTDASGKCDIGAYEYQF